MKKSFWLFMVLGLLIFLLIASIACEALPKEEKTIPKTTEAEVQEEETIVEESPEIKAQPIGWIYCLDEKGDLVLISMVSRYELKSEGELTCIWWKDEKDTELMWNGRWLYSQQMLEENLCDEPKFSQ